MPVIDRSRRRGLADETVLSVALVGTGLLVAFYVAEPLGALILLVIVAANNVLLSEGRDRPSGVALFLPAAFVCWMAISIMWTPDKRPAFGAVGVYITVVAATLVALAHLPHVPRKVRRATAAGFVLAMAVVAWGSLEEAFSGHFFRRALNSAVTLTRARSIELRTDSGWIVALQKFATQKSFAALTFMLWPALLVSLHFARTDWQRWLRWASVAAAVVAVGLSDHQSSKLALAAGALVFFLTRWSRQKAWAMVAAGWVLVTLLVVPVMLVSYWSGSYKIEQIQYSGRHRLVLWGQTSERILKAPLRGYGLASTRVVDETAPPADKSPIPGTSIPGGTNVHSHNIFLQTWHEIGGIGAVLLMLAGLPVLGWLRTRSATSAPYLLAAFTSAVVVASLSWSLVAAWFVASFGFLAVWACFADLAARDLEAERPPGHSATS